jgi:hypothetical protein
VQREGNRVVNALEDETINGMKAGAENLMALDEAAQSRFKGRGMERATQV